MRDVYAIILHEADEEAWSIVRATWDSHYVLTPTVAFIRDAQRTTDEIRTKLQPSDERLLVIFDVSQSNYSGRSYAALWEWFSKVGRS